MITEDLLKFAWEFRCFNSQNVVSVSGQKISVVHPGYPNFDEGPDFFNAKVKIENTLWAGNIEIHVKSSDWEKHRHQENKQYNNLILHVVWEHDKDILSESRPVATIELKGRIPAKIIRKYQTIIQTKHPVLCKDFLPQISSLERISYLRKLYIERLERKYGEIQTTLNNLKEDWNELFYRLLMKYIGGKVNQLPFELLAKSLPLKTILKHQDNLFQIEAMMMGQAGFLEQPLDYYQQALKREYDFLAHKYHLQPIEPSLWKFLRLRPPNFPTVRIAQAANILHRNPLLFQQIIDNLSLDEIYQKLSVPASEYWDTHYLFGKTSARRKKTLGKNTINNLIINVIVPLLFQYYKKTAEEKYLDKSIEILENLPPEKNHIIEIWEKVGVKPVNGLESQALIQLKNEKCRQQQCLNCNFGRKILQL